MAITTSISPAAAKPKPAASKYTLFTLEVLLACAVAFFFTWPQYKTLQAENTQLSGDKSALVTLQAQAAAYQKSVKELQGSNMAAVNQAIPVTDSITDLYAYVESLVNAGNLTIKSIQVTDASSNSTSSGSAGAGDASAAGASAVTDTSGTSPTPTPSAPLPAGIQEANIHLVVTGTTAQLSQLLASFQNSLRLIDVQDIQVSVSTGGGSSFTIDALTYYQ